MPVDVVAFVRAALPPPPARVLELGAGAGQLAATLREAGYDVLAIDPVGTGTEGVTPVALLDVDAPAAALDAAVAVRSLHHVQPLEASCRWLGKLVRPGGRLVIDEVDVALVDERAARWLNGQRGAVGDRVEDPAAMVADLRGHLHTLDAVRAALAPDFHLGEPVRGAYLHRWYVPTGLRASEEALIAQGRLPATGARLVGVRLDER